MECVAWDLRWKIALGLPVDHRGLASDVVDQVPRPVVVAQARRGWRWRTRCGSPAELGMLEGAAEQIIDSTPMLGAAATQDTVRLVRHGVRKLIDAVAAVDEDAGGAARSTGWSSTMSGRARSRIAAGGRRPSASGCSPGSPRTPSGRCGPSSRPTGCSTTRQVAAAHQLLRELIGQDFDIDAGRCSAAASRHPARTGSSRPSTPRCATVARASQRFDGYKLSAAATNTQRAADHRGARRAGRRDRRAAGQAPDRRPAARSVGRSGSSATPPMATARSAPSWPSATWRCSRPCPEGKIADGRLGKRDFEIDLDAGTVTCPAGHTVQINVSKTGFRGANFAQRHVPRLPAQAALLPGQVQTLYPTPTSTSSCFKPAAERSHDPATAEHLRRSDHGSSGSSDCSPTATARVINSMPVERPLAALRFVLVPSRSSATRRVLRPRAASPSDHSWLHRTNDSRH